MTDPDLAQLESELTRLRVEVRERREAMHAIYWLNTDLQINHICEVVYGHWTPPIGNEDED